MPNKINDGLSNFQRYRRRHHKRLLVEWRKENSRPERQFQKQKAKAKARGIDFLLTFEQWWKIWQDSGHYDERGCRHGQYVMARFGDKGPYSVGNVRIVTVGDNALENLGLRSQETHNRFRFSQVGTRNSAKTRKKKSAVAKKRERLANGTFAPKENRYA